MTTHLRSGEWTIAPIVDHAEAVALIERWHYSKSAPNTSTARHGLYRMGETIMAEPAGVAMWMPPTRAAAESVAGDAWQSVLCLTRLVVAPDVPTNGASFLLGRSMKAIDRKRWPILLTYADTRLGHTGAIYKATNWLCLGETPAGDCWLSADGQQRGRKRGGRTLLASEMRALGYAKAPAAPKIKFVHFSDAATAAGTQGSPPPLAVPAAVGPSGSTPSQSPEVECDGLVETPTPDGPLLAAGQRDMTTSEAPMLDEYGDPIECLDDHGEGTCRGPIGYHTTGRSMKAWPRCDFHFGERLDRYENSIERYADSDLAPAWFDPSAAGERWDDDY